MTQLTSNTQAFVHKEQYGKSTKKRKSAMKTMKKKPMGTAKPAAKGAAKRKPMGRLSKPKKQGY